VDSLIALVQVFFVLITVREELVNTVEKCEN